jgi:hypothetical protein
LHENYTRGDATEFNNKKTNEIFLPSDVGTFQWEADTSSETMRMNFLLLFGAIFSLYVILDILK